jgi:two-component system NtrC family sensor kinase
LVKGAREFARGNLNHRVTIKRQDEIAELAEEFNSMAGSLLKYQNDLKRMTRLAALSRFAAMISHEIKNPLNSMNINMQILKRLFHREDVPPDRKIKYMDVLSSEISRINELINNFLAISRPPELSLHLTDVHKILNEVTLVQEAHAIAEGVRIQKEFVKGEILGMFDFNQLKQVFHNIIVNAIDAMMDGGELKISTYVISKRNGKSEENGHVRIEFADTGVGMSKEVLKEAFEFYYTTKPTGTGLGLAIAKQIIEGHNGKIYIKSQEGSGTAVSVELPINEYSMNMKEKVLDKK